MAAFPGHAAGLAERGRTVYFARLYHPAAPFAPGAVAALWRRCRDPRGGAGCREGRRQVEAGLGSLEALAAAD